MGRAGRTCIVIGLCAAGACSLPRTGAGPELGTGGSPQTASTGGGGNQNSTVTNGPVTSSNVGGAGGNGGAGGGPGECGDGVEDRNEECDDGNVDPLDGCSPLCTLEDPGSCTTAPVAMLSPGSIVVMDDTTGATDTVGDVGPCNGTAGAGSEHVYGFMPDQDSTMLVELDASYGGYLLFARADCLASSELDCSFSAVAGTADPLSFPVTAGTTYYVFVDSYNSGSGSYQLTVTLQGCGDGVVDGDEECDDGNAVADGNGCTATCEVDCGGAVEWAVNHHCYHLDAAILSWDNAYAACLALGPGWDLLGIASVEERNFVDQNQTLDPSDGEYLWIGGNDLDIEGTFVWTNGETWFPAWDSAGSQPNGGSAQNCVALIGHNGANNDAYQDRDCVADSYPFICEQIPAGTF